MSVSHAGQGARYQRWEAARRSGRWTWLAIVSSGVRLRLRDSRNLVLMLSSLSFVVGGCTVFYVLSLMETLAGTAAAGNLYDFVSTFLGVDMRGVAQLEEYRAALWASVFFVMAKAQLFYLLIVIARLGPGLIADDLKSNALPIYFARPITPLTYLLGKWATIAAFIAAGMLLPNLLSLLIGTLITGGLQTTQQTLALGWYLTVAGVLVMVVGGVLILALSSFTADKRYVTVAWLALVLLPAVAQQVINESVPPQETTAWLGSIALHTDILVLVEWLLDLRTLWEGSPLPPDAYDQALGRRTDPLYPAVVLGGLTLAAITLCYRRVVKFSQAATSV